ncbi:MAG TPA: YidB family protein [Albitalea sp.]|nr:YidB family protein [Albitalea sp.]
MGLLDSVIGALSGARSSSGRGDMLGVVLQMLADDADGLGIEGLAERFDDQGMTVVLDSWIGRGRNLPISAQELERVLGAETMDELGHQLGVSRWIAAERLSQMLPYVVDKLTPLGRVPEGGLGDLGQLMGRMARG